MNPRDLQRGPNQPWTTPEKIVAVALVLIVLLLLVIASGQMQP